MKRFTCQDCRRVGRVRSEHVFRCRKCANRDGHGTSDGMFNRPNRRRRRKREAAA